MGAGSGEGGRRGCSGYVAAWGKSSPSRQEAEAGLGRPPPPPPTRVVSDLFLPPATVPGSCRQLRAQGSWRSVHPAHSAWDARFGG